MSVAELLLVFLSAAIALAGFAGIVAQIDRGAARVSHAVASFRVRYLVIAALCTVVLSASPLLAILLIGEQHVWPAACGLEAALILGLVARFIALRHSFVGDKAVGMKLVGYRIFVVLGVGAAALLVAGAAGYAPAAASYATGVFWFLLVVMSLFNGLVFTLDDALRRRQ